MTELTLPEEVDPHAEDDGAARRRNDLDRLINATYEELHRVAAALKRGAPNIPISPSTLVHEAWIRLEKSETFAAESRLHFKRIAAKVMRGILVDEARRQETPKRGGGAANLITLDDSVAVPINRELVALDDALRELEARSPRQAELIEVYFFAGCDAAETAEALGVSKATVERDWRAAKAWLLSQIRRKH